VLTNGDDIAINVDHTVEFTVGINIHGSQQSGVREQPDISTRARHETFTRDSSTLITHKRHLSATLSRGNTTVTLNAHSHRPTITLDGGLLLIRNRCHSDRLRRTTIGGNRLPGQQRWALIRGTV
jgi:hypothetical protein